MIAVLAEYIEVPAQLLKTNVPYSEIGNNSAMWEGRILTGLDSNEHATMDIQEICIRIAAVHLRRKIFYSYPEERSPWEPIHQTKTESWQGMTLY